jgi:hypothetical protein
MNTNIKEVKINVGTRNIYLASDECFIMKSVLDSLDLDTFEDK